MFCSAPVAHFKILYIYLCMCVYAYYMYMYFLKKQRLKRWLSGAYCRGQGFSSQHYMVAHNNLNSCRHIYIHIKITNLFK